jgi:opacity protein-like surface antigen
VFACHALPALAQATDQRSAESGGGPSLTPFMAMGDDLAIGGGLAVAFPIDGRFSVEAEASAGVDAIRTGASILVNLRRRGITPYAAAGIGFQRDEYEDWRSGPIGLPTVLKKSEPALSIGGGASFPVSERWSYRADFRWYNPKAEWPESWRVYSGLTLGQRQ